MCFRLQVYQRYGTAFQDWFTQIMVASDPDFSPVKPYGNMGDRKNDGFNKVTGTYYQVFAPIDPQKSTSVKEAIEKLHKDFKGLYDFWNNIIPIKCFYFVVNDEFLGYGPFLDPELVKIEKTYPGIECKPFYAQHLEKIFLNLSDEEIFFQIGRIPDPELIEEFEGGVMNEVIQHLTTLNALYSPSSIPINPNFDQKLEFKSVLGN